jgi:hypothetical protein
MININELKKMAEDHLSTFHAESMPPMKISAQTMLALIRKLENARNKALEDAAKEIELLGDYCGVHGMPNEPSPSEHAMVIRRLAATRHKTL